jgi:co-chaperonin GroES (HSP10)
MNDAAQSTADEAFAKFPQLAKATGSAPVKIPVMNSEGSLTGANEDLGLLQAPDPVGHFMLVALPEIEKRNEQGQAVTAGGIILPETVTDRERAASVVGTVLAMGPDCYKDEVSELPEWLKQAILDGKQVNVTVILPRKRFPSGSWCKIGDTVLFSRYAGKRFKIEGIEFRMLADDEITATIPEGAKVGGL